MASISLNALFPSSTIFSASARHVGNAVRQEISTTPSSEDAAIVQISQQLSTETPPTETAAPTHNSELAVALSEVLSAAGDMVQHLEKVLSAAAEAAPRSSEPKAYSGDDATNLASFMKALNLQAAKETTGAFFADIVKSASHAQNSTGVSLMGMLSAPQIASAPPSFQGKIADEEALSFSTKVPETPLADTRLSEAPPSLSFSLTKIAAYESSGYEGSSNALDFKVAA